ACLCGWREVLLYVRLPKCIAKSEVSRASAALVARQHFLCAAQSLAECKIFVDECGAEDRCSILDRLPAQIRLPVGDRSVGDETVYSRKEFRILNVDRRNVLVAEVLEVLLPVPVGSHGR